MAGQVARARAKAEEARAAAHEARGKVPPVDITWSAWERDRAKNGNVLAGAVAFRLFIYMLPLYLLALVAAGVAFAIDPKAPEDLASNAGVSSYIAATIAASSNRSNSSLWLLIPVTLYALGSAGLGALRTIVTAHASAWDLPPQKVPRPWVSVPAFLAFTVGGLAISRGAGMLRHGLLYPLATLVGIGGYFGLWLLASRWLPRDEDTTWRSLVPGALLVAAGAQGLYWFNLLYLSHKVASASEAYGALGIAATTLLWLYLIGRLIVAAPMLNATLHHRARAEQRSKHPLPATDAPSPP